MPHYLFEHIYLPPPTHLILNHLPETYFSSHLIFIHVHFILSVSLLFVMSSSFHNKHKFVMFNFSFYEYSLSYSDTHNNNVCTKISYESKLKMGNLCLLQFLQPTHYLLSELAQQYKIPSWQGGTNLTVCMHERNIINFSDSRGKLPIQYSEFQTNNEE